MKGFILTISSWDTNGSWIRSHTEPPLVLFLQPKSARIGLIWLGRLGHYFYAQFNGNYGNWIMQSMLTFQLFPPLQKLLVGSHLCWPPNFGLPVIPDIYLLLARISDLLSRLIFKIGINITVRGEQRLKPPASINQCFLRWDCAYFHIFSNKSQTSKISVSWRRNIIEKRVSHFQNWTGWIDTID